MNMAFAGHPIAFVLWLLSCRSCTVSNCSRPLALCPSGLTSHKRSSCPLDPSFPVHSERDPGVTRVATVTDYRRLAA